MSNNNFFYIPENIDSGQNSSQSWVEKTSPIDSAPNRKNYLNLSLSNKKIKILMYLCFAILMILWSKSFYLQVAKGGYYFNLAENNRLKIKYVKAPRGIIYDRNEQKLVNNVFGFSLFITPADLPAEESERNNVIERVAYATELGSDEIKQKIANARKYYYQPVIIKEGIEYEKAMSLMVDESDLPGVVLEVDAWRQYDSKESLSHLLGYIGKLTETEFEKNKKEYLLSDNIGKSGLEKYYEYLLRGRHGRKRVEVDALGYEKKIVAEEKFEPGADLVLSIDAKLQEKIYQILKQQLNNDKAAVVIASNPQNGEILAMVDYPAYDNNLFSRGIDSDDYQELLNNPLKPMYARSVLGEYPSGSTIKPIIAAAALQERVITAGKNILSTGGIWYGDKWFYPDWKSGGHGWTDVYKAISQSVNTYFYYIGGGYRDFEGLGVDRLNKYFRLFGLGQKTGIDLPSEKAGLVPTPEWKKENKGEQWYIGDTYHISIGQGDILITPLQANVYNNIIANGGIYYKPRILKEIHYPQGGTELIMPQIIRQDFIDREYIDVVKAGMRRAVTDGSAVYLANLQIDVAGKTGTAQWHPIKDNHAWFNGFAPYNNPTFSLTVIVEEGGEGSAVAVPIAKEIFNYYFGK